MTHPFTAEEVESAYALLLSRQQGNKLTEPYFDTDHLRDSANVKWRRTLEGERYAVFGESLTEDTLILLSLVSPDLAKRVSTYRAEVGLDQDAASEQRWLARREALGRFLSSGRGQAPTG